MNYGDRSRYRRRLTRSADGLTGVCGGIAEYFNLRKWAVRLLAFIALWIFFPVSLIVYIALAIMMKPAPARVWRHAEQYLYQR